MVRINLVRPVSLADQHIVAEYNEILMLIGHIKKYPKIYSQPNEYKLGRGHINFFKNKTKYLKDRHELIKKEMKKRGFKINKTINLNQFKKEQKNRHDVMNKNIPDGVIRFGDRPSDQRTEIFSARLLTAKLNCRLNECGKNRFGSWRPPLILCLSTNRLKPFLAYGVQRNKPALENLFK